MKAPRIVALGLVAVVAVVAAMSGNDEEPSAAPRPRARSQDPAAPAPVRSEPARATVSQAPLQIETVETRLPLPGTGNPFGITSWRPPPPPPPPPPRAVAPPPPPPPTAPPLPFTYLGRYVDASAYVVFLMRGDRLYQVAPGDVIEATYRFEGIVGGQAELTYLPLNQKQSISTGDLS